MDEYGLEPQYDELYILGHGWKARKGDSDEK